MNEVLITLITVLGGVLTAVVGYVIWKKKKTKVQELEQKKIEFDKEKQIQELQQRNIILAELCNYVAGAVDIIIQDEIEVRPEVRAPLMKFEEKYHSLDLTKDPNNK